uniref:ARAD1D33066p n=1 Tax=Blastobotrys adeninivorans TaxID=409370 RepID=A0A060TGS5_BLAAD
MGVVGRFIQCALYSGTFASSVYTLHWLQNDFVTPISQSYGSHFQFVTILGLTFTGIAQLFGLFGVLSGIRSFRNIKAYMDLIAAPLEVLISVGYWGIVAYDRKLLMDPEIAPIPPLMFDIFLHALPAVSEIIDVLVFAPRWTKSYEVLPLFFAVAGGYWSWVHLTFEKNGFFPYPLFAIVDTPGRAGIFTFATLFVSVVYGLLKRLQNVVRG